MTTEQRNMPPSLSVVIPAYNEEATLALVIENC